MDSHIVPACLESLFTSNLPPVDSEAAHLRHLLAAAATGLNQVDSRIGALHEELARLLMQRDDLVARMEQYKAVLSPVRRIPPEVLCEILEWLPPGFQRVDYYQVAQPPWRLAHICSLWRETAIGCPSLWTGLGIIHADDYFFPTTAMLEAQLDRTASAPLHIDFELSSQSLGAASAWDSLLPLSHRWKSLRIRCVEPDAAMELLDNLQAAKDRVTLLEKVDFFINEANASVDHSCDCFSTAPRLRELHLTNSTFTQYSPAFAAPWAQITSYRGVFPPARQLDILRACLGIVDCTVGYDEESTDPPLAANVTLPLVRRLHVEHVSILANITSPALHTLLIPSAASHTQLLVTFLQRSSCRLNTLVITKCDDANDVVPVLASCPGLEQFVLSSYTFNLGGMSALLDSLCLPATPPYLTICPNLASFALGWKIKGEPVWCDVLLRMLQSRLVQIPQRLRSVCLFTTDFNTVLEKVEGIRRLENEQGLDFKYLTLQQGKQFMAELRP
ncbi:hypothetical protein FB45DRAFT_927280 [Roridomyces roridus]|uniref:F-box domain-containing protein n=1 Tax=Roridomyces roridus TaxID=1738132 RepID=A0AAD7BJ39_9AGAR|nr:hypothetical protein FB45DRAFT_927280 [Roridomyces roridus]